MILLAFLLPLLYLLTRPFALTGYGQDAAVEGFVGKALYVGLFKTVLTEPLTSATTSGSVLNMTGAKGKGYVNNKVVVFTELNGKTTKGEEAGGLVIGRPYFIKGEATNGFEVTLEEAGTAITPSVEIKTTTKVRLLEEATNSGSSKRIKTAFTKNAAGEWTDTEKVIQVLASTEVTYAGWWEGEATGKLVAVEALETAEKYTGAGEYKLTADKVNYSSLVA